MVYSGYNFYLGLPIIAVGIFDQDVPAEFALRHPRIAYATGLYREFLNFPTMSRWTVSAFLQGLLLFAIAFRAFAGRAYAMDLSFDMTTHNGTVVGLYGDGYIVYTCLVFAMQCKVASMTCTWTIWNVAAWTLSFLGYFSFTLLYSLFPEIDAWYMVPEIVIGEQQFWLVILLVCTTFCIIDGLTNFLVSYFAPTADLILRMMYAGDSTASPRHFALWASWPRFTSSDLLTIGTTKPVEMKKESEQLASEDMSKPLLGHEVSQKQHASA
jgi:magnesium-transporting ATPase (P-type)